MKDEISIEKQERELIFYRKYYKSPISILIAIVLLISVFIKNKFK